MKNKWQVKRIGNADIVGYAPTQEAARKLRKQVVAESKNSSDFEEEKVGDFKICKGCPPSTDEQPILNQVNINQ